MERWVTYECMESSNIPCKTCQVIAPLRRGAETSKHMKWWSGEVMKPWRNNETAKRQTTRNRCGQWWVKPVRGQPTNRTDKTTRRAHEKMSRLHETASRRVELGKQRVDQKYRKRWNATTKLRVEYFFHDLPSYRSVTLFKIYIKPK